MTAGAPTPVTLEERQRCARGRLVSDKCKAVGLDVAVVRDLTLDTPKVRVRPSDLSVERIERLFVYLRTPAGLDAYLAAFHRREALLTAADAIGRKGRKTAAVKAGTGTAPASLTAVELRALLAAHLGLVTTPQPAETR